MASGSGTRAHVVTRGASRLPYEQPRSAAARGSAVSHTGEPVPPVRRGTRGASVAPPLGQCPRVPGYCPRGPGVRIGSSGRRSERKHCFSAPRDWVASLIGDRLRPW